MTTAKFDNIVGVMLVYDITNLQTFENIFTVWLLEINNQIKLKKIPQTVISMLVGNKVDLV